jgi:uncharacterized protein
MLSGVWVEVVALVAAFVIAVVTTPAGVFGGGVAIAVSGQCAGHAQPFGDADEPALQRGGHPGAIWRYRRQGQTGGRLTWLLLAGTLPGVVAGSVIRVAYHHSYSV